MNSISSPLKPTWQRYIKIFLKDKNISIYRALEYEALSNINYSGRLLDFGGGEQAHYIKKIKSLLNDGYYESINISPQMEPTYLIKSGGCLPLNNNHFDMVLSVNTLEHIYDLESALNELTRVLKQGGKCVFAAPFLYRVYGCPDDFNRPTASWWLETLSKIRFFEVEIYPLVWDPITTGLSVSERTGPFKRLRRTLVPLYGLVYSFVKYDKHSKVHPQSTGDLLANYAMGYVITGVKS